MAPCLARSAKDSDKLERQVCAMILRGTRERDVLSAAVVCHR